LLADIFKSFGRSKKRDPDEWVLSQLKKAGSDLSKPHALEFFLYFPKQSLAEQAALRIKDAGFQVEVKRAAQGDEWLCLTARVMVPELTALQKIRSEFTSIAGSLSGQYDGWGAPVVG
jgi:regulator of RNase E activity RraB